jgi:hypothetical protein
MIVVVAGPVAGVVVAGAAVVGDTAAAATGRWLGGLPAPATDPASTAIETMKAAATSSVPMLTATTQTANLLPEPRPRPGEGVIVMERLLAPAFFRWIMHQGRTQQNPPAGYAM